MSSWAPSGGVTSGLGSDFKSDLTRKKGHSVPERGNRLGKGSEVWEALPAAGWGWGQMLWGEAGGGPPVSHPVTLNSDEGGDGV